MLLIKFRSNWADEFDVDGFFVTTKENWQKYIDSISDEDVREMYFGTNEAIEYSSKSEYLKDFNISEISEKEFETLSKMFGRANHFGWNAETNKFAGTKTIVRYGICSLVYDSAYLLWE